MKKKLPTLFIVVPCYNEQEVLPKTFILFLNKINQLISRKVINSNSRILFVDDGSKDNTWNILFDLSKKYGNIEAISLSRNRGHQNALFAGLMEAKENCDITISMDCDGQDDINAIDEMLNKYSNGCDVVYGVRSSREKDSFFKKFTAESYYKLLELFGVDVVFNHADYRLLSKTVLDNLANYEEVNLFLRGMIPLLGFKSDIVYYKREERVAGKTHYPLNKMIGLAIEGITSLSIKPIISIFYIGIICFVLSLIIMLFVIAKHNANSFQFICSLIIMLFSIQMISIGIIGEYIGKTYIEAKKRPRYIIEKRTYKNGNNSKKK